jgi:PleD family two-component response regulator
VRRLSDSENWDGAMKRILSVDDKGQDFEKLGKLLREQGFSVTELLLTKPR